MHHHLSLKSEPWRAWISENIVGMQFTAVRRLLQDGTIILPTMLVLKHPSNSFHKIFIIFLKIVEHHERSNNYLSDHGCKNKVAGAFK